MTHMKRKAKRIGIGLIGGIVLIAGVIAIPYPGPGILIVLAGLGILATEFEWARTALHAVRMYYDKWQKWLKSQSVWVQLLVWLMTAAIVVLTLYLLNGYGILDNFFHLGLNWVHSPLSIFN